MFALDTLPKDSPDVATGISVSPRLAEVKQERRPLRFGIATKMALLKIALGAITAAIVSAFLYHSSIDFVVKQQQQTLATSVNLAENRIFTRFDTAGRDLGFLLKTPAVRGFIRASANGGVDPVDGSSLALTRNRVADLFEALLEARLFYFKARILDRFGNELIRVDGTSGGVVSRTPEPKLQPKGTRPFFLETAMLPAGQVYTSDIDLNQENGKLEEPHRSTARIATPIYDGEGALLGVLVLNLDIQNLFDVVSQTLGRDTHFFIANNAGDYLANPDPSKTFGFDLGKRFRIQDDFPGLSSVVAGGAATFADVIRQGGRTDLLSVGSVAFDPLLPRRHLVVAAVTDDVIPAGQMLSAGLAIGTVAAVVLIMGVITALVLVRVLVTPLRRIKAATVALAAGERDVDIAPLTARNDEIGDLATAVSVMVKEISEREDKLRAQTAELTRSNQELAQFAYVASHDLQEPLRMVGSYLELLSRRYEGKLDGEAQEFIGFAVDGATRMKRLINDLLGYSRAGSSPLKLETVDIGEVVDTVLAGLALHIEETHADVAVGPMPKVTGDAVQLGRVFQNLIENALKYRSSAPPRIRIAAERVAVGWQFSVTDNGIGIDPRFREQIFEIFKRLHGRDKYSGTGIGLAVTKLVVERHGGKIWIESAEGGGSTFIFTLPDTRMG